MLQFSIQNASPKRENRKVTSANGRVRDDEFMLGSRVLRFPLPPPNPRSNRCFSSTSSYNHGPRTPQALDAAIRYAAQFTYDDPPPSHPLTSAFMQLPDPFTRFGDIRRPTTEPPSPPPPDVQSWLRAGAPPLLENHFFGHISLDQLITLIASHPYDTQALQTDLTLTSRRIPPRLAAKLSCIFFHLRSLGHLGVLGESRHDLSRGKLNGENLQRYDKVVLVLT